MTLQDAISRFGHETKAKLTSPGASGAPEDQLRAPLEVLIADLAALAGIAPETVVAVGESSLADLKTRPDYAITRNGALIGFIEVKAPGKGANPRHFRDRHDKEQWAKLRTLPNLIYTDGNAFSLWRDGELEGKVQQLVGDIETAGKKLAGPEGLVSLFANFFQWKPQPPRSAVQLAVTTARLCRLLREEVTEQMGRKSPSLTNLAKDWRKLLFPNATDAAFADGYAQAITFGLLMAPGASSSRRRSSPQGPRKADESGTTFRAEFECSASFLFFSLVPGYEGRDARGEVRVSQVHCRLPGS